MRAGPSRLAWCWFLIALFASLGANVATAGFLDLADPPALLRVGIAGWPALAFLGGTLLAHSSAAESEAAPIPPARVPDTPDAEPRLLEAAVPEPDAVPSPAPASIPAPPVRPRGGQRLHAFFATLYYCALRPEEAIAMRVQDVTLPGPDGGDQWCELLSHTATPEVGKQWTDTGEIHEERDLKGRAEGETRTVPGHPALTRILRQHIEDEQLKPGDLLFQGEAGGILAGSVIRRAWRSARKAVLLPHVFDSPTGRRVYDNRHTRLTKWLNDGIPPAQVAEWAGNSVPVLLAAYARCVEGQLPDLKRRLEAAGDLPEPADGD
ncbi:integrase [Streptomyces stelliscabiei]|uniref:Integrase n=1 Tax=Streptomyces stelliscabiei TaxID=146820 RepID=A0A8I0P0L5_9ACTN|nr:integrase [Streptomyces stelliscabiei]